MLGKLLPREPIFFDFFEKHALITVQATKLFLQYALNNQLPPNNPIKDFEHQADEITHQCLEALRKSFITPLQQEDIFRLISRMDDVIDGINHSFANCLIYKIASFTPAAQNMLSLLVEAVENMEILVKGLRNRKKDATLLRSTILKIHELENKMDVILRNTLGQLFEEEGDIRLLIKWKDIYEGLEKSMNFCEDVADIVESIILEYD